MRSAHLPILVFLLAAAAPLRAATFTVTTAGNSGAGSLRQAISDANANAGADTIVFDTAGVFSTAQTITLGGGQLVITGALTIDAPSAAGRRVTISANHNSRVLSVQLTGAGTVMLNHLTLRDGETTDNGGNIQAASPAGSTLALDDCTVTGGDARDGGGIDAQAATLALTNTLVSGNDATRNGGGIITQGTTTITGGACSSNHAVGNGGGLHADGATVTISAAQISTNGAALGGGIFAKNGASITVTGGTVTSNNASGDGGGIRATGSATVTALNVSIDHNYGDHGGGIAIRSATFVATNCLIVRNTGGTAGGGIHFHAGAARVKNCTIAGNDAPGNPYGLAGVVTETGGMSVGNTIISDNPIYGIDDVSGAFVSLGHNLIGARNFATGFTNGVDGDLVGEATARDAKIDISTYAPKSGSPCLEAGDAALVTSPLYGPIPAVDFAGNPRIRGVVDIGAIEGSFNAIVTNDADSGAGSLRAALVSAPSDVSFDPAYFGSVLRTITLTSGQIVLGADLTIVGPAPGVKISGGNSSRAFTISGGAVTLRHVRVIDGSSTSDGGGIRVINAGTSLTLEDSGVSNCVATGRGGGLYLEDGTISVTTSTFSGNAAEGDGGGIHVGPGATLSLTNSTVSNNGTKQSGGGLFLGGGTATVINCTVAENTADSDNAGVAGNGGGIRRNGGTARIGNSIIAKNTDASTATEHPDVSGVFVSLGHNLIGKSNGLDASSGTPFQNGVQGDQTGTIATPLNPALGALQLDPAGSPTRVHPLLPASPARDAGDAALLVHSAWPAPPANDQRGQFRTVGAAVDLGAVEYPGTTMVKLTAEDALTSEQTLQPAMFRIRRAFDTNASLVVNVSIDPSSTASAADYVLSGAGYAATGAATFTVTIPAGKSSVLLTMLPVDDNLAEGREILALTVAAGAGYLGEAVAAPAVVAIYDNELNVTSGADSGPGSLRQAIADANIGGGAVITLPQSLAIHLASELAITSEIDLFGNRGTIDAGGLARVFSVLNYGSQPVVLRNLTITGGQAADYGGGVLLYAYSDLEMRGCTVQGNTAPGQGGGIFADYQSTLTLTSTALVDNVSSSAGGGIAVNGATVELTNVTLGGNRARGAGGGLSVTGGTCDFTNCTITENLADSANLGLPGANGGGLSVSGVAGTTYLTLRNTVVAGNWDTPGNAGGGTIQPDFSNATAFFSTNPTHNFIGINAGAAGVFPAGGPGANGNYAGTAAFPLDAQLTRVRGVADTFYEFSPLSLLLDHGISVAGLPATDQRGLPRTYAAAVDIGSVEMDFLLVANANAQNAGSLRAALAGAGAQGHGTIIFDPAFFNVPRTIALGTTGELAITSSCTISPPADPAARVTISGSGNARIFNCSPASAASIELRSLALTSGSTAANAVGNRSGAGLLVGANASVVLSGCEMRSCDALNEGGAAIILAGGALTASDSTFSGNHAGTQGGAILNLGTLTLDRVLVRDNNANAEGAGLGNAGRGTLTNCTFSNNRANSHGGAIYNLAAAGDTLALVHCTLTQNHANQDATGGGDGGGIRRAGGVVALQNTIVSGNDALLGPQDDLSGAFPSLGHNLIGLATGGTGFTNGLNGDLVGASAFLGPLQNNGGPTPTHALLAGSAAIDAAATIANSTDQRGVLRNGALNDIGAYELLPETYAYWAAHTFGSATNAGSNQDYDGDGKSNEFEFGAGSDATSGASVPGVLTSITGSNYVADFALSALAPAGTSVLRYSTNLTSWQTVAANLYQVVGTDPARNAVLYRVTIPMSFGPNLFLRLEHLP